MSFFLFFILICAWVKLTETVSLDFFFVKLNVFLSFIMNRFVKGRFLKFQRYHNFANLFSKFSESTLYKEKSKFQ